MQYIECELDPEEFKQEQYLGIGQNPGDQGGIIQPIVQGIQEAPIKMWTMILTLLFFVMTPLTESEAYTRCRRKSKKLKRNLSKSYR